MGPFDEFGDVVGREVPLAPMTWFRLGGAAEYLARPKNVEEVQALVARCREADLPLWLLGGGSNVLVRDEGVRGLVLQLESPALSDVTIDDRRIEAGAAVPLTALISQAARAGLGGLEVLTGIPGTVGGALRGNSGSRQGAIGHFVRNVTVLAPGGEIEVRDRDDVGFGYRSSNLDEAVILSAELELERDDPEAVVKRMRRVWIVKKENQPYGHQSSGVIFKNPSVDVSAGLLVEQAGLKAAKQGGAEISDRHANYIVAQPGASSADVLVLIDRAKKRVWEQFGYDLELQLQVW